MKQLNKAKPKNIHVRIYEYVLRVIVFTKHFPKTQQNTILLHQLIKSVTSIGANDKEADAAESRKDFIAKYSIVKKETNESLYWIQLLCDLNPHSTKAKKEGSFLISEGTEILKIVSSIIIKTKRKI